MEALLEHLVRLLLTLGPWIVFATTFVETSFFIGLLVPAEAVVILAAVLAEAERFDLTIVFLATFFGALLGDQAGYLLGRFGGNRVVARGGRVARLWHAYEPTAARLFRRHAALSISMARFISFVRTLMPWFAGMSEMRYARFLAFDLLGVLGWTTASIAVGYVAGRSWRLIAARIGYVSAYIVGFVLLVLVTMAVIKRIRMRRDKRHGLLRVALTGNIASGKSEVTELWRTLGASIIDADVLARRAVEPGSAGFRDVVREFGPAIVSNGDIDRAALRSIVFNDERKRKRLEAIVHPEVRKLRIAEERKFVREGSRVVVNDIPLLFETGMQNDFDIVVLVDAPEAVRVRRIVDHRGLTEAEARRMVDAQMPAADKRLPATYVIDNDGTLDELHEKAQQLWLEIVARAP